MFGLSFDEIPDDAIPLEAIAVIKCLDQEGNTMLYLRATEGLSSWESLGMLSIAKRTQEDSLAEGFIDEGEDDE